MDTTCESRTNANESVNTPELLRTPAPSSRQDSFRIGRESGKLGKLRLEDKIV